MRTLTEFDKGWLVGIIDGEGWIGQTAGYPCIRVNMCDPDTVKRLHEVTGIGTFRPVVYKEKEHHKDLYSWTVAREGDVEDLILATIEHFSARRQDQCRKVLRLISDKDLARLEKSTNCPNGHLRSQYMYTTRAGVDRCRECSRLRSKAAYAAKKEEES